MEFLHALSFCPVSSWRRPEKGGTRLRIKINRLFIAEGYTLTEPQTILAARAE